MLPELNTMAADGDRGRERERRQGKVERREN
jgi:hypothetical protein